MVRTHGAGTVFRDLKLMSDLYNNNGIIGETGHKILDLKQGQVSVEYR